MNIAKFVGSGALVVISMFCITENAWAELTYRDSTGKIYYKGTLPNQLRSTPCPPAGDKGTVTDITGNVFKLFCDSAEYQGLITLSNNTSTAFGRCVYLGGLNVINFEVDEKNKLKQIEWLNVNPVNVKNLTKNQIYAGIGNPTGKNTEDWLPGALKFLKDNMLTFIPYITKDPLFKNPMNFASSISEPIQEISNYVNGELISTIELTIEEADEAYGPDGTSPISFLNIDPLMGTPNTPPQDIINVPEPSSTLSLLALCTLGAGSAFNRKQKTSKSAEKDLVKVS